MLRSNNLINMPHALLAYDARAWREKVRAVGATVPIQCAKFVADPGLDPKRHMPRQR